MDNSAKPPTATNRPDDRRKSARYLIKGGVWFTWRAADGERCNAVGITRDIGRGGLLIESKAAPPIGSMLKLIAEVPVERTPTATLQLSGVGFVCYVNQTTSQRNSFGVTAVFHADVPISEAQQRTGNDCVEMLYSIERRVMPRWKKRCEETRFDVSWVLVLAVLFVIAKQTIGVPPSWWWILASIPLGLFLDNRASL